MATPTSASSWGLDTAADNPWQHRAACRNHDPDPWIIERDSSGRLSRANQWALRTCQSSCPVRQQCHDNWAAQPHHRRKGFIAGGIAWGTKTRTLRPGIGRGGDRHSAAFKAAANPQEAPSR